MPIALQYRPVLIDTLISNERVNSYQSVFQPANDVELMGVYLWNSYVCGTLYPLIGAVEITLRNAIDQALATDLGAFWWSGARLRYRSYTPGATAPYVVQAVHDNLAKAARKYIGEVRSRYRVRGRGGNEQPCSASRIGARNDSSARPPHPYFLMRHSYLHESIFVTESTGIKVTAFDFDPHGRTR